MLGGLAGELLKLATGHELPSGSDVLAGMGMDPESMLTKGLGFGADMLSDPTMYLGGAAIGGLNKLRQGAVAASTAAKAAKQATLLGRLERLAGSGLDEAMMGANVAKARAPGAIAGSLAEVAPMRGYISPESLATGATRTFKNPEPGLMRTLESLGLGSADDAGIKINAGLKRNMAHADVAGSPGIAPPFAQSVRGRGKYNLVPDALNSVPLGTAASTPEEVDLMRRVAQSVGPDIASIHGPAVDPFKAVANQRYLGGKASAIEDALGSGLDVFPHSGPFTMPVPGVPNPGVMAGYGPAAAIAGLAGLAGGVGWGMGGKKLPWER